MTTSTRPPSTPAPDNDLTERDARRAFLDLSGSQVVGGALAAATSALALSFLGVAGTLVGAIVGSLVATIGAAIYSRSLGLAAEQLRVVRPNGRAGSASADDLVEPAASGAAPALVTERVAEPVGRRWVRLATGLVLGVVLALAGITGVELLIGHPVSGSATSGTTIGQAVSGGQRAETSTTAVVPTSTTTSRATSESTRSTASATPSSTAASTATQGAESTATTPAGGASTESPAGRATTGTAAE